MITQERLHELLDFNPETGLFTRKFDRNKGRYKAGTVIGGRKGHNYIRIWIDGKMYYGHHLAWLYVHGEWELGLDHRDRDGYNNAISNLRKSTRSQNAANQAKRPGSSRFKGVSWNKRKKKHKAAITVDYKTTHLGYFDSDIVAHCAYSVAAYNAWGEYARAA